MGEVSAHKRLIRHRVLAVRVYFREKWNNIFKNLYQKSLRDGVITNAY